MPKGRKGKALAVEDEINATPTEEEWAKMKTWASFSSQCIPLSR